MAKITTEVVRLTSKQIENISKYENWRTKYFGLKSRQSHAIKDETKRADKLYRAALVGFAKDGEADPSYKAYQSYMKKANYQPSALSELNRQRKEFVRRSEVALSRNGDMTVEEKKIALKAVKQYANRASFEDLSEAYNRWFDGADGFNTYYEQHDKGKAGLFKSFDTMISKQIERRASKRGWWSFVKRTKFYNQYMNN